MSRFFVYRPVFGWVIAAFVALAGLIALVNLPIEQYPNVAPPSLTLAYSYTGADADTLDHNVTSVIEKEMNGIEGFLYMASTSRRTAPARSCSPSRRGPTSMSRARWCRTGSIASCRGCRRPCSSSASRSAIMPPAS